MRKLSFLLVFVAMTLLWGTSANAQCPSTGENIQVRFDNLAVDCSNSLLAVDVQIANPTGTDYSVSGLSLRFTFNGNMVSNPVISSQGLAGTHSLNAQSNIYSYGVLEFSSANLIPGTGAWTTVGTLTFDVIDFSNAGNDPDCIDLAWVESGTPTTTANQWISFVCQPNMVFTSFGNSVACIGDSCNIANPNDTVVLSGSVTDVSCGSTNNGAIDLTISGGATPYSIVWSNAATTEDISGLSAGSYSVTVTDNNGDSEVLSGITVAQSNNLQLSTVDTDITCFDAEDGSIDLTVTGGDGNYTYIWSNGATTEDVSDLPPGTYSVTVTDGSGCSGTETGIDISEPGQFVYNAIIQNVNCNGGNDGSLDFSVTGGNPPFTYFWVRLDPVTFLPIDTLGTNEDLDNLEAGQYFVTVVDSRGCRGGVNWLISQPTPIVIAGLVGGVTDVSCHGGNDGQIDVTTSGGTGVLSYVWSNGETSEDLDNEPAGTYSITATDLNGCTATQTFVIDQPDSLIINLDGFGVVDVTCYGGNDGAINVTVSGGTPPYFFSWTNGDTTEDVSGLTAGDYTVQITDSLGCVQISQTFTVGQPDSIALVIVSKTNISCFGNNDGAIDVGVSGGTPPYEYLWSNGDTVQDISSLPAGPYTLTVTDSSGCTATITDTIDANPSLTINLNGKNDVSCFGYADGSIDITVTGG